MKLSYSLYIYKNKNVFFYIHDNKYERKIIIKKILSHIIYDFVFKILLIKKLGN